MYLTEDGYKARFGADELADVLATDDTLTFEAAEADAESIVDGYLAAVPGRVFAVPLVVPVPARLVEITADLTRYELHAKRSSEEMRRRRDEAIAQLEAIATGKFVLAELTPEQGAVPITSGMDVITAERVFTSDTLRGYVC